MKFKIVLLSGITIAAQAMQPEAQLTPMEVVQPHLYFEQLPDELLLPALIMSVETDIKEAPTLQDAIKSIEQKAAISPRFDRIMNDSALVTLAGHTLRDKFGDSLFFNEVSRFLVNAVSNGKTSLVRILLATRANPNTYDNRGQSVVMLALRNQPILEILLDAGADPNVSNGRQTALELAMIWGLTDVFQLLLDHHADPNTALALAVTLNRKDIVQKLLAHGADPNLGHGKLLRDAAARNYADMTQILINAGADVNLADRDGITPLREAERRGSTETLAVLKEAAKNPEHVKRKKITKENQ